MHEHTVEAGCARLRRTGTGDSAVYVVCYDLARELLVDRRLGLTHPDPLRAPRLDKTPMTGPLALDPERAAHQQQRMRAYIKKIGDGRRAGRWSDLVRDKASRRIEEMRRSGAPADYKKHVAARVPLDVITSILGVSDDTEYLAPLIWQADVRVESTAQRAILELHDYLRDRLRRRKDSPHDDLLTEIAEEMEEGATDDDLVRIASLLLLAGTVAPTSMYSHAVPLLLRNRDFVWMLFDDQRRDDLVNEILRFRTFYSPTERRMDGGFSRYTAEPVKIAGLKVDRGSLVVIDTRRANFDPYFVDDPERFDPTRRVRNHLSYSWGPGRCPGSSLATLELGVILQTLFQTVPTLELAEEPDQQQTWPGAQLREVLVTW